MKRKAQWSFRMVEEKRNSFSAYFITLTYSDKHLPYGEKPCINKNDHFEFIKNLKEYENPKVLSNREMVSSEEIERIRNGIKEEGRLKYYGVSEYGDLKSRPHWHYILFNVRDSNNISLAWNKGIVQIDPDVNVNNIDYVLKYMLKVPSDRCPDDNQKEVSFMSKGIGADVVDAEFIKYISTDQGNQVLNSRGNKIPLPRYYRKKYLSQEVRERKNSYISKVICDQEIREDKEWIQQGLEPGKMRLQGKENRNHLLKSRVKRNKV